MIGRNVQLKERFSHSSGTQRGLSSGTRVDPCDRSCDYCDTCGEMWERTGKREGMMPLAAFAAEECFPS